MIRPEESLLLKLCRLDFSEKDIEDIGKNMDEVADWSRFCMLANSHGIAAITFYILDRIKQLCKLPDEYVGMLRNQFMLNMRDNVYRSALLTKTLATLNASGIKTVLLKGMALEQTIYGNKGLRQMSDVDVLMTKDDCLKAWHMLLDDGFVSDPVKSFFHKKIMAQYGKHLPTLRKDMFALELHHELVRNGNDGFTAQIYETAVSCLVNGKEEAYVPCPQLMFIYLIHHLFYHEQNDESQLRMYTDLVVLLEKYEAEILNDSFIDVVVGSGLSKEVATKMYILKKYWGMHYSDVLDGFIDKNADKDDEAKFLFFLGSPKNKKSGYAKRYRSEIEKISGISNKVLYVLGDIFPSISFMKKRYNCGTFMAILHYPHRLGKFFYLVGCHEKKK